MNIRASLDILTRDTVQALHGRAGSELGSEGELFLALTALLHLINGSQGEGVQA